MAKKSNYISPQSFCYQVSAEALICSSPVTLQSMKIDDLDESNETDMGENW